ncbi:MAG TPA: DEAD/DEAH box helicase family protein [Niabella sp.]|nr:DEAD/DEAH box helicase family protein [Niabella sp.]HUN01497.1 DEAD/DEAH box helicase family protein [Niabella sp.]
MRIKFDSTQAYQVQAVNSFIDLFDGQPLQQADYTIEINPTAETTQTSMFRSEMGIGNNLVLSRDAIFKNLQLVQERNDLDPAAWEDFNKNGLNFSVEMETGTGKTYVYLRTIFELSQKYGFKKFIIVVPSVAIREGTLKNIEITADHFKALYNNIEFEHFVYDSKKANRLRQFATSNQLQIMIINIDAFNKDTNIFNQERNQLNGFSPRGFINAVRPFVLIDEPQSVDNTTKAQEAIKSLNPIAIFRFSATHKNLYNLIYKLDPIKAYELGLVKQIVVASVTGVNAQNDAYIKLLEVNNKAGIKAKIRLQVQGNTSVKEKDIWVKQNADLFQLSNERESYKNGFEVLDISAEPGNEFIDFTSGRLYVGQERGGITEDLVEVQIKNTIKKHLDKELQLKGKGIKVLSLFFVDKVSNYRVYGADGKASPGKYAALFEQHYNELIKLPQYQELNIFPVDKIHDGYFSADKKGVYKDTNGNTQADDDTYAKIMRNKEQLLSMDEPLKYIFSHSALREGWDNPNVFQICVLREVGSTKERRQTLGRGLRLPVNQIGERVKDENINKLTVIARESYADFASGLQKEYEEDCGVTFGKVPKLAFAKLTETIGDEDKMLGRDKSESIWKALISKGFIDDTGKIQPSFNPQKAGFTLMLPDSFAAAENEIIDILQSYQLNRYVKEDTPPKRLKLNKQIFLDPEFENLWKKINLRTTYQVDYSTDALIANAVKTITTMDKIEPVKVSYREAELDIEIAGITMQETRANYHTLNYTGGLPDILGYLQKETELTRNTLVSILSGSNRLQELAINPQKFMDAVSSIIKRELYRLMIDGIKYEKLITGKTEWSMQLIRDEELKDYFEQSLKVNKSVYDSVIYDSEIERKFAEDLDKRTDIKLFVKLPSFFKVETPIGTYNPDWAIVKHDDDTIYLVRETKSTKNYEKLRNSEADKIKCGRKHFEAIRVDFDVVTNSSEV